MIILVSDPRLIEAPQTGEIAGLSSSAVVNAVMAVDLLREIKSWRDLKFMFPTAALIDASTWAIPVIGAGRIAFNWIDGFGPVNLHLRE